MSGIDPQFEIEAQVLAQSIDDLDYFQVLKVPQDASASQVRAAFHAESRAFHPDRFYALPDGELKRAVFKIYKRITEAYMVLRDHEKRQKYTADVNGPERAAKLRFTEASEAEQKKAREEQEGKTPQARQCYRQATLEIQRGRWEAAERQLKTALMYEPDNPLFRQRMQEVEQHLGPKGSGGGFSIR